MKVLLFYQPGFRSFLFWIAISITWIVTVTASQASHHQIIHTYSLDFGSQQRDTQSGNLVVNLDPELGKVEASIEPTPNRWTENGGK